MNNQFKHLLLLIIAVFFIASCDEDKYGDWKILNENWYSNFIEEHKDDPNFHVTESGLAYHVIHHGHYPEKPYIGSGIQVTYKGKYISGKQFDKKDEYWMALSETIPGWKEGIIKMNTGSNYIFYIPYQLGYGEKGSGNVPPYSTLIFDIKLDKVYN